MSDIWIPVHQVVHFLEERVLPLPTCKTLPIIVSLAPAALLLGNVFSGLSKTFPFSKFGWLQRMWRSEPQDLHEIVRFLQNIAIVLWASWALQQHGSSGRRCPLDFVADRVVSESARKSINHSITEGRKGYLEAGHEIALSSGYNHNQTSHQIDTEMRRRGTREARRAQL